MSQTRGVSEGVMSEGKELVSGMHLLGATAGNVRWLRVLRRECSRLPAIRHCKIGGERGAGAHGAVRVYVYVSGNAAAEGDAADVVKYWERRAPQKEEKDCLPVHTSAAP